MTTSSSSAAGLLPATRRALAHRVAVGQAEGRTPSLAAAVVRDGGQAWFGSRSMLDGHEPDGDTQYRIGSLTKTFIAVLVMRLRDEGLFASYSDVQFRAPVRAGDVIEATATVTAVGRRSRQLAFEARVVCRGDAARGESAASALAEPVVVVTATGTVVVPAAV